MQRPLSESGIGQRAAGVDGDPDLEALFRQLFTRMREGRLRACHKMRTTKPRKSSLVSHLMESITLSPVPTPHHEKKSDSAREKEIVRLVAKGFATKAIAAVLDLSTWTVATHLRRIFAKLGVSSRAEMVAKALENGLLEKH